MPRPSQNTVEEVRVQANAHHGWMTLLVANVLDMKYRQDVCPDCQKLPKYKEYTDVNP